MYRYKLTIQYDGTEYHGWQVQKNHTTIQDEIEKSLNVFLSKKVPLIGAGRTDSGVHALGQVAHFDLDQKKEPRVIVDALNARLNNDIQIKDCVLVDKTFHARFSAKKRFYLYRLRTDTFLLDRSFTFQVKKVDFNLLKSSAELIKGTHDFTSFSKHNDKIDNRYCTCLLYTSPSPRD